MTRGGLTFGVKSEPFISTVRLNRQSEWKCADYRRAGSCCRSAWLVVPERARERGRKEEGGRDGGRGELQG